MPDPVTKNKGLIQPPNAADPGTWDQPMNNNSGALDTILGDVTQLNAATLSGTITLSLANYRAVNIVVTGALGGNLTYLLPAGVGGFFFVQNNTTGGTLSFGSASSGATGVVTISPTDGAAIVIDSVFGARLADSMASDAAGSGGQVQYNDPATGNFAGAAGIVYTPATQGVALGGPLSVLGNLSLSGLMTTRLTLSGGGASTVPVVIPFAGVGMAMNCALSNVFSSVLSGNVTGPVVISNQNDGQTINWVIQQDGTGSRTMAWPTSFKWPGGTVPALSTGASAIDLLVATYSAPLGWWLASLVKGFA